MQETLLCSLFLEVGENHFQRHFFSQIYGMEYFLEVGYLSQPPLERHLSETRKQCKTTIYFILKKTSRTSLLSKLYSRLSYITYRSCALLMWNTRVNSRLLTIARVFLAIPPAYACCCCNNRLFPLVTLIKISEEDIKNSLFLCFRF